MSPFKALINNGWKFLGICLGIFLGIILLLNIIKLLVTLAVFLFWEHPSSIIILLFIYGAWRYTKHEQENAPPQIREEDKFDIFN